MKNYYKKEKLVRGDVVKHKEYGKGVVAEYCDDGRFIQVRFQKEPPKPTNYKFSANPFVVPVETLEKIRFKKETKVVDPVASEPVIG